jgi:RNA polymerase sigma-70 factor (ECF subfamily)
VSFTTPEGSGSPTGEPGLVGPPTPSAGGADLGELLRRSGRADEAAFAELYDAMAARVYGLAVRVVRDPSQAEEVTQEAFLETWRTASRFDPAKGSAVSWILTIVHRKAVDRVRSAEAAQASLEARRVRAALGSLTEVQREALELAYFKGYTHTEVAAMLDLPLGTAKTRIRDGLIRLRDTMGVGQ